MAINFITKNQKYTVVRSRRRSIAIVVRNDGSVEVRCPGHVTKKQIEDIICSRTDWIRQQQRKITSLIELPDIDIMTNDVVNMYKLRLLQRIDNFMSNYSGPRPEGFTIRRQKTRWGSCSSRRNINLNLKSVFLPDDLFEYLMEHELAHLVHMNHSVDFWTYLENRLPDARIRQRKLKNYKLVSGNSI